MKNCKLEHPNLNDFSEWVKGQADFHDECFRPPKKNHYIKGRYQKQQVHPKEGDKQIEFSGIMLDGSKHSLSEEKLKSSRVSVEDRRMEVAV